MKYYAGIDLHSNNNYIGIIDESNKRVFKKKVRNDLKTVLWQLEPYRSGMEGVVVESTFNWYWMVDGLMDNGYRVHLANPSAIKQYEGLKYGDDVTDTFHLANLLRLGILPEGYIYPKEERAGKGFDEEAAEACTAKDRKHTEFSESCEQKPGSQNVSRYDKQTGNRRFRASVWRKTSGIICSGKYKSHPIFFGHHKTIREEYKKSSKVKS
jgi:hypothetical protein